MSEYENATIVRAPHDKNYFCMHRSTAQDRELSWEARGVIAYILSKPDGWEINVKDLEQGCKKGRVYRILDELKEAGYLEGRKRSRDREGKWQYTPYILHERPMKQSDTDTEKPGDNKVLHQLSGNPRPENPDTDKPDTEKPYPENREILQSTEVQSTENQSSSGSLKVLPSKAGPTEPMIDETDRREIKRPLEPKRTPAMETALRAYTDVFGLIKKSEGYRTLWVVHSLIDEHGIAKVQSAIQRCRGRVIHKPLAYIRSICQTDDRPAPRNSETPPPGTRYEYVVGEGQGSITDSASDGVRYPQREAV